MSDNIYRTSIWNENRVDGVTEDVEIYGYNIFNELYQKASFEDVQLLMYKKGEKPTNRDKKIYKILNFLLLTKGLRDEATLAASNAIIGGALPNSGIVAAAAVNGGLNGGAKEISLLYNFFKKNKNYSINELVDYIINYKDDSQYTRSGYAQLGLNKKVRIQNLKNIVSDSIKGLNLINTQKIMDNYEVIEKMTDSNISINMIITSIGVDWNMTSLNLISMVNINSLHLIMILALEQQENGFVNFPFYMHDIDKKIKIKDEHIPDHNEYFL